MWRLPFILSNFSPPLLTEFPPCNPSLLSTASGDRALLRALGNGVSILLSFGLFISSPQPCLSITTDLPESVRSSPPVYLLDKNANCQEDEGQGEMRVNTSRMVTNESIVEEAWETVYESFLDTTKRHRWSPETWLQKKEDVLGTSIHSRSKAHDIIRRMLASLGDNYTRFLAPSEFSKMARYDMTGIGINLREIPDDSGGVKLRVLGLLLDGPAHTAGVRQGDELLTVNGVDVRGKSAFEASSLLQGPSGTFVNIMVKHGNCGLGETIEVQRQSVARTPVFYRLEQTENGPSVGYVRLKEFNALARKDLITAIKRLKDMGATYFVLDLRDNLGGLVQAGIEIAKLFLNKGETVTYTIGRDPQYVRNIVAELPPLVTAPVIELEVVCGLWISLCTLFGCKFACRLSNVRKFRSSYFHFCLLKVLVNKNTASASEIVATAVHDNCRAVLVGERTYGKGLIQSVFELHDGSGVVVTVGKYVTPNHMDINGNGVEPDFQSIPAWADVMKHLSKCQKPQEEG